ncbi:hypothetical protein [Roseivivax marinus]|uniref:hypothetical protein n=1 Tax=Roseivivax marinus TaxID=1379903 RepID=UPI00273F4E5A|nr:hypothetical protein [Roseivivax marinus]
MMRALWLLPFGLLVLLAFYLGWRQGYARATLSETEVISAYAERYLADRARDGTAEGASPAQCRALPGEQAGVWLVVVCGPEPHDEARHYTYYVRRSGALARVVGPGEGADA